MSERAPAVVSGARELLTGEARVRCGRYRSCQLTRLLGNRRLGRTPPWCPCWGDFLSAWTTLIGDATPRDVLLWHSVMVQAAASAPHGPAAQWLCHQSAPRLSVFRQALARATTVFPLIVLVVRPVRPDAFCSNLSCRCFNVVGASSSSARFWSIN